MILKFLPGDIRGGVDFVILVIEGPIRFRGGINGVFNRGGLRGAVRLRSQLAYLRITDDPPEDQPGFLVTDAPNWHLVGQGLEEGELP